MERVFIVELRDGSAGPDTAGPLRVRVRAEVGVLVARLEAGWLAVRYERPVGCAVLGGGGGGGRTASDGVRAITSSRGGRVLDT